MQVFYEKNKKATNTTSPKMLVAIYNIEYYQFKMEEVKIIYANLVIYYLSRKCIN
jgi:hypothetical protein